MKKPILSVNVLSKKITDGPHETPEFVDEGIPFISVDGIQEGELIFKGCRYVSPEDHEKFCKKCQEPLLCLAVRPYKTIFFPAPLLLPVPLWRQVSHPLYMPSFPYVAGSFLAICGDLILAFAEPGFSLGSHRK